MFGRTSGQDFSRNFCRKLQFFKVSGSFECLIFPGLTTIRLKSRHKSHNRFRKNKIENFQSEETLEIEISREEQLMNIIERMDKFRCDDSDSE